ncbi:phage tail protein I [Celerinatantimonas sp. MCCC 1A17872]|uniref:phage tail protein I n=1 Tax=Celerinatantimonas sp. MCCC 1A17872 TaxID=3177514 RepID=UPI0038C5148A
MSVLPPNASALERELSTISESVDGIEVPIRAIHRPADCPSDLMPYLAWARSVDRWDASWSDAAKRQTIADSYFTHAHKGTIAALRRVVEPLGFLLEVIEWWQEDATPGTFRLIIGVKDQGITDELYALLELLIDDTKPVSRQMQGLMLSLSTSGEFFTHAATYCGDDLTVYAYMPELVTTQSAQYAGGSSHQIDTLTIQPQGDS